MASKDELDRWAGLGGKVLEEAAPKKGTNKTAKTTSFVAPDGKEECQRWWCIGLKRMKGPTCCSQQFHTGTRFTSWTGAKEWMDKRESVKPAVLPAGG
jgi:hypothetical protein